MYTLIEIFDAKQYENVLGPMCFKEVSNLVYVGTKEVMTTERVENIKLFFKRKKVHFSVDFLYVERDNSEAIKMAFSELLSKHKNCIFDVTGGEDVILSCVGIISEKYNTPVVRINLKGLTFSHINGTYPNLTICKPSFSFDDFITLQGGRVLRYDTVTDFSHAEADDIMSLFSVNAHNCEVYSAFCSVISEFISYDKKSIVLNKDEYHRKTQKSKFDFDEIFSLLRSKNLISKVKEDKKSIYYNLSSYVIGLCLLKAGNVLEYYTALSASALTDVFADIRVGASIEWDIARAAYETQNEIDVTAISQGLPVFISCKNGEVKKEALYELDTVSRKLGGPYSKKILVCTYISKNPDARDHFIKRAEDMGIKLIFNSHSKPHERFLHYLKIACG